MPRDNTNTFNKRTKEFWLLTFDLMRATSDVTHRFGRYVISHIYAIHDTLPFKKSPSSTNSAVYAES